MKKKLLLIALCILVFTGIDAQSYENTKQPDSLSGNIGSKQKSNIYWKPFIAPTLCIGYGLIYLGKDAPFNIDLHSQNSTQSASGLRNTTVDNYLQFVPALSVYALGALHVQPAHDFWQRTKIFVAGNILMALQVFAIKNLLRVERPNKEDFRSFPSGHTANAFLGADFFYREFKYKNKWWIYSGYAVATTVAALRVIKNKHWLSDVVAGAGFGILSNRISYLVFDRKRKR